MASTQHATAAVWLGDDRVELKALPLPAPRPGDVVVAVDVAAVCGSDIHTVSGARPGKHPSVLGHEAVGRVVAVGPDDFRGLAVGDRIVWGVACSCGSCSRCDRDLTAKCEQLMKTGHEALDAPWGELSGCYSSHIVLPAGVPTVVVPDTVPDDVASIAACSVATVMACMEAAGDVAGRRVLIIGAGMLGLTAIIAASSAGAAHITVTDIDDHRLKLAPGVGATHTVNTLDTSTASFVEQHGHFDVTVELAGAAPALELSLDALDVGGTAVWGGAVRPSAPVPVDPERIIRRAQRVVGVHNYEPRHLSQAVDLLASADVDWGPLICQPVPLGQIRRLLTEPSPYPRETVLCQPD